MRAYTEILRLFEQMRNEQNARWMTGYMRNRFKFFGLQTPQRRSVYKSELSEARKADAVDWDFLDTCWNDEHREFQYLVTDLLHAMQRILTYDDIAHIEKYVRTKQWWDTIDNLDRIVGNIAFVDSRVNDLMLKWSTDGNMWVCRVAIDHQRLRKDKTDTALLERILTNNFGSSEFFINKAIGWSLRDYSKTNSAWVRDFIARHRTAMSPLSIREASKYI